MFKLLLFSALDRNDAIGADECTACTAHACFLVGDFRRAMTLGIDFVLCNVQKLFGTVGYAESTALAFFGVNG
jgi:hypothetical protein